MPYGLLPVAMVAVALKVRGSITDSVLAPWFGHVKGVPGGPYGERVRAVWPDGDRGGDPVGAGVDGCDTARAQAGDVGAAAAGADRNAERARLPQRCVDRAVAGADDGDARQLVGDVEGCAVGRNRHTRWEPTGGDRADDTPGRGVDDRHVAGSAVGGVDRLAVRCDRHAQGLGANPHGCHDTVARVSSTETRLEPPLAV